MTTPVGPINEDVSGGNTSGLDSGSASASVDQGVEHTQGLGECSDKAENTADEVAELESVDQQASLVTPNVSTARLSDTNANPTDPPPPVDVGAPKTDTSIRPAASPGFGKLLWKRLRDNKRKVNIGLILAAVATVYTVLAYYKDDPPMPVPPPVTGSGVGKPLQLQIPPSKCTDFTANETCLEVKSAGSTDPRSSNVETRPNSTLVVRVKYKNLGSAQVDGVILKLTVPDRFLQRVEGSTRIWNSKVPYGSVVESEELTKGGVNVGSYAPGGAVWLEQVYLVRDVSQFVCGMNALVISAVAYVNESYKQDAVTVRVNSKEC